MDVMFGFFEKRKYPRHVIQKGLDKVKHMNRKDLLKYKPKVDRDLLTFPVTFNKFNQKVVGVVLNAYRKLKIDPIIGEAFEMDPTVAFRRGKNIKDMVVRTKSKPINSVIGTFPCNDSRCLTCLHTNCDDTIIGPSGFVHPHGRFTCKSCNVIYVIYCEKCAQIYVGETCRELKERFKEHRRLANYLLKHPRTKKKKTEVGIHFSTNGHTSEDMRVAVFKRVRDLTERKIEEQRLIATLGAYLAEAMNVDFDFLTSVYDHII